LKTDGEFGGLGWPAAIDLAPRLKGVPGTATTIALIATDAVLTKPQAKRLAIMANDGLARAILPAMRRWTATCVRRRHQPHAPRRRRRSTSPKSASPPPW